MKKLTSLLHLVPRISRRFKRTERGAVAVMVALAVIPLMVAGGLAIDLSRAYLVKSRLSHALDAAGLAVGSMRTASSDPAYLESQFNSFFTANYAATEVGTTHDLTFVDNGGVITVTGQATVDTVFMSIVGIDTVTVASNAEITVETNGLELVLVLDNTGSMSGSPMTSMKNASYDLIDIIFGDETTPDLLKVGLVPFSNTVNIGSSNTAYVTDPTLLAWNWVGILGWLRRLRAYPADVTDSDTATDGLWTPYFLEMQYSNGTPRSVSDHNGYCPPAITPLTNNKTTLESGINAMVANGGTHINLGAIWGWRAISPTEPFTEGASYGDPDWTKAVILLTDGDNWSPTNTLRMAYGYLSEGNLGTTSYSSAIDELDDRLEEVCTGMKAAGIVVYTITFGSVSPSTETLMSNCATDADKYFNSPDSATLTTTFRAIGAELKNLHLSQ